MVRLILIVLFFLLSLLSIFRAPTNLLWYAAILVTEFPWIFLIIQIGLLCWGLRVDRFAAAGNIVAIISIAFYLVPVITASVISKKVEEGMEKSFPTDAANHRAPFSAFRMFTSFNSNDYPFRTMTYTSGAANTLSLDFYSSALPGDRPCVIVVHGGSWAGGNSKQLPELNAHLAKQGYHVAAINYRLAPEHVFPAQIEDLHAALAFLKEQSRGLNIDTANFVLLGRSAGGQLVLSASYGQKVSGIKGVIAFYGPADLVWGAQNPANPWVFDSNEVLRNFLGGRLNKIPQAYAAASPVLEVDAETPPTLLLHGQSDVLVAYEHSIRLQKKLQAFHIPHYLLTLPWATHGFDYTLTGPGGQLSTYCVDQFLKAVTGRKNLRQGSL
ncbi:MAG TPA: alpha/beta hydrolase [Flavisolibacter sp.]|nr:alpha/beta hydrolase [Flavisolibacter sp.]